MSKEKVISKKMYVWQRWEHTLISEKEYGNPYAEVVLKVTYNGPNGHIIRTYGFWDGENSFKIRCAFPEAGEWSWHITCSDEADNGLHNRCGTVYVTEYTGNNPIYKHGFPKVSENKRYLIHADGTPFLWLGDTAWFASFRACMKDWEEYINDRVAKSFSVIQITPVYNKQWDGPFGIPPFTGEDIKQWNPVYWRNFEEMLEYANQKGIIVLVAGLMEPISRYPDQEDVCLYARNLVARLFGNCVIFSPSLDSLYMDLGNKVGEVIDDATPMHLITQHPATPWGTVLNEIAEEYYHLPYLDFSANQTGHNNGNLDWCAEHAINWNMSLYNKEPHKPVINIEAFYDSNDMIDDTGSKDEYMDGYSQSRQPRSLGYLSWLSGSMGYTYGANGVWNWKTDPGEIYWKSAINYPSSLQMKYMYEFFSSIEWWTLEPAHHLILNQEEKSMKKMAFAVSSSRETAIAYLPDNNNIQINMSDFPGNYTAKWFNPVTNAYMNIAHRIVNCGMHMFKCPGYGDWILLLQKDL